MYFELGENATDVTGEDEELDGSKIVFRHCPVRVSQMRLQMSMNQGGIFYMRPS